jgi:sec-independent protein translocase protein TatA
MMFRPEPLDLVLILLVALLLFGANRLPETARSIGKAIREFRAGIAGEDAQDAKSAKDTKDAKDTNG